MALKFCNLISYAMLKGEATLEAVHPEWDTMIDSGGFTNFTKGKVVVSLEEYIYFLKKYGDRFWKYMALDRIGDKETSIRWLEEMKRRNLNPVPIFQRGESSAQELLEMLRVGELVAIGGISQNLSAQAEQEYLSNVMKVVYSVPQQKVHLLGVGVREAKLYNPYSADSSTWASHGRFGILRLWYQGKLHYFQKHAANRNSSHYVRPDPNQTRILMHYNLDWQDLYHNPDWHRPESKISVAAARSWMRQSLALRRKGCRYVLAILRQWIPTMREAWKHERRSWGWTQQRTYSLPKVHSTPTPRKKITKIRKQRNRFSSKKMQNIKK